ncbi:hypothetical protein HD554DRAFT_2118617 [Boletus coccyginus]|nr:hypothetical protein HD554DRAFT_2118617 [Boletus coccyginus]
MFSLYTQPAHTSPIVSSPDLSAARTWIRVAQRLQHFSILPAYETTFQLLTQHLAALLSSPQHLSILRNLTSSLAVDAFSACILERAPAHAVELLEQGRGVFWSQLIRLRSTLDDIVISNPIGKTISRGSPCSFAMPSIHLVQISMSARVISASQYTGL